MKVSQSYECVYAYTVFLYTVCPERCVQTALLLAASQHFVQRTAVQEPTEHSEEGIQVC